MSGQECRIGVLSRNWGYKMARDCWIWSLNLSQIHSPILHILHTHDTSHTQNSVNQVKGSIHIVNKEIRLQKSLIRTAFKRKYWCVHRDLLRRVRVVWRDSMTSESFKDSRGTFIFLKESLWGKKAKSPHSYIQSTAGATPSSDRQSCNELG